MVDFSSDVKQLRSQLEKNQSRTETLQNLDLLVLDNSIRESTVGQLRGHTLDSKMKIFNEVKKCGFKYVIVAAFSHMTRVDDNFVMQLYEQKYDMSNFFCFSEAFVKSKEGFIDTDKIPIALKKMVKFKLINPILEIDLAVCNSRVITGSDSKEVTVDDFCELLLKRFEWVYENMATDSKIFVNLRDFSTAMKDAPERVLKVVHYLSSLAPGKRPFGIVFEEPTGNISPQEIGVYTASIRKRMKSSGWESGNLLVHIHKKWGLGDAVQLECLANGANGIWAGVCEEGAATGHACSTLTLMNLIRMGNKKVLQRYNCTYLRTAAIRVTELTTGRPPHPKQQIYGERALDIVFDGGMGTGIEQFDTAQFFGVKPPKRISTLASLEMIKGRLVDLFGHHDQFSIEMADQMKEVMLKDLNENRKEEYMSDVGIAMLMERAGGKITAEMRDIIAKNTKATPHATKLIEEVRAMWDEWDLKEEVKGDDCLEFHSFYNGFMAPYFGCFRCEDTIKGLQAIDMDNDGLVDWNEFAVYLKWALRQNPDICDVDELLSFAFRKGLVPAMQDEIIKKK